MPALAAVAPACCFGPGLWSELSTPTSFPPSSRPITISALHVSSLYARSLIHENMYTLLGTTFSSLIVLSYVEDFVWAQQYSAVPR